MTSKMSRMNPNGTLAWKRSLMEFTNTTRGAFHERGWPRAFGWRVTPNPGPDVTGFPSFWYFSAPIALSRLAKVSA